MLILLECSTRLWNNFILKRLFFSISSVSLKNSKSSSVLNSHTFTCLDLTKKKSLKPTSVYLCQDMCRIFCCCRNYPGDAIAVTSVCDPSPPPRWGGVDRGKQEQTRGLATPGKTHIQEQFGQDRFLCFGPFPPFVQKASCFLCRLPQVCWFLERIHPHDWALPSMQPRTMLYFLSSPKRHLCFPNLVDQTVLFTRRLVFFSPGLQAGGFQEQRPE